MSDYKALLKHSGNYLLATIATKALAFVSLPVYTHLMTVEEYGVFNVFISTAGIAAIILTLNTEVAVSRYYYDAKNEEDFKHFVGATVRISSSIFVIMSLLMVVFIKPLSDYLGFEKLLTLSIIPVALYSIINSVFQQIYQPLLQSKKISIVSSIQAYLAFGLSTLFIILLDDKKYYGQVWGTLLAMLLVGSYSVRQIKAYYAKGFDRQHVKYILSFSLPYLPYSLSGILIAQFGKLIIGQQVGFESAGLYSFSSNIAMLMLVFIMLIHSAWNPYYFTYMNEKDHKSIDNDYNLLWRLTLILALGLSVFVFELGSILGKEEYLESLYLIPILVLGYCFYQWAYVYLRNVGYAKKTIWNAIIVVISGLVNIGLNYCLIGKYGLMGIAISFSVSYIVMMVVGLFVNNVILKVYAPSALSFLWPLLVFLPFWGASFFMTTVHGIGWFLIKASVFLTFSIIIGWPYRKYVGNIMKKISTGTTNSDMDNA